MNYNQLRQRYTVYPKKCAHGFCFVVVIHWLIFPYPSGLFHWHCGNLTIAPVPAKQPWWIWMNTSCASIMNDCITTTKQSTTKPCAYFLGYTVCAVNVEYHDMTLKRVTAMPLIWFQTADAFTATNFYVSSESSSSGSLSSASDGVYPNIHSSCVKTNVEANPWLAVDMGAVFIIQRVFLYKAEKGKDCGQLQFCVYSFSLKLIRLNQHDSSARADAICDRTPQELCT